MPRMTLQSWPHTRQLARSRTSACSAAYLYVVVVRAETIKNIVIVPRTYERDAREHGGIALVVRRMKVPQAASEIELPHSIVHIHRKLGGNTSRAVGVEQIEPFLDHGQLQNVVAVPVRRVTDMHISAAFKLWPHSWSPPPIPI
jgi:hypothetical protein